MKRNREGFLALGASLLVMVTANAALAQKPGGILRMYSPDSPASMSIHEESTVYPQSPMMGVLNNLIMFNQHVKQNSLESISGGRADQIASLKPFATRNATFFDALLALIWISSPVAGLRPLRAGRAG
jgi:hypothetical protein